MKNKVIDFRYANIEQKAFLEHLEIVNDTKYPNETLNVPMWLILALHSELSEVLNASKLNKFWDKSEVNRAHLIKALSDLLSTFSSNISSYKVTLGFMIFPHLGQSGLFFSFINSLKLYNSLQETQ